MTVYIVGSAYNPFQDGRHANTHLDTMLGKIICHELEDKAVNIREFVKDLSFSYSTVDEIPSEDVCHIQKDCCLVVFAGGSGNIAIHAIDLFHIA